MSIAFPARTLKWIFIILATWGVGICVYESGIIKNSSIQDGSTFSGQHGKLRNENTKNSNGSYIYDEDKSSHFLLMKNNLTKSSEISGSNKSHNENLLSVFRGHINSKAVSKMRKMLISSGYAPPESIQIYLHNSRKTIDFSKKSQYRKRPDRSPWLPEAETCAVLGSGGILKGSECGNEIDSHDLVFRSNMAPIDGFVQDVGKKTNLMSINVAGSKYVAKCLDNSTCRSDYLKYADTYLNDSIIWMTKIPDWNTGYKKFVADFEKYRTNFVFAYPNPRKHINKQLSKYWKVNSPSSGLYIYGVAATICRNISLYGFYPYNRTESGRELSFHYYANESFENRHDIPKEYNTLLKLNRTGAIRLVTRECRAAEGGV